MTLATWKAEFYPVEASECPKEDAIAHSLRKWQGLRAEALLRHGVAIDLGGNVSCHDGAPVKINSVSCALCHHYLGEGASWPEEDSERCKACSLAISRGGKSCDAVRANESRSPWSAWSWGEPHNPEPMIAALEEAQRMAQEPQGGA